MSGAPGKLRGFQGTAAWAPHDVPKRGVTPEQVRYALEKRRTGWGWQAIANVCGVNQLDLRQACGDPTLDPTLLPAKPLPVATAGRRSTGSERSVDPTPRGSRAATLERHLDVLRAILRGAVSRSLVAERLGLPFGTVDLSIRRGRLEGWLAGSGHGALHLTDAGRARLAERDDG